MTISPPVMTEPSGPVASAGAGPRGGRAPLTGNENEVGSIGLSFNPKLHQKPR